VAIFAFALYSAFCYWVIFKDGAEVIEGWKSAILVDFFAAFLDAKQLRVYVAITWLISLVSLAMYLF